ncbi:macro domain-containing protein [Candidatus Villigracilis proximus]|uniref:macro domain-containing protein n=1 Tax=Candidatus Villigracilis proximus TaxID=3140683 RepID=UPI0031EC2875
MNTILVERNLSTGQTLQIVQGDITIEEVDSIVNAANEYLQHGGGVAWAIVRRGGDVIQTESDKWIKKHGLVSRASSVDFGRGTACEIHYPRCGAGLGRWG